MGNSGNIFFFYATPPLRLFFHCNPEWLVFRSVLGSIPDVRPGATGDLFQPPVVVVLLQEVVVLDALGPVSVVWSSPRVTDPWGQGTQTSPRGRGGRTHG